ncbi:DUF4136 domain-containing protein [Undibacterium piscinae]|uniref:DUF4136 domain-containing protein n=1 Tax=Undibacterium piscinae TaxID=2495591 RepID=A0A6M4A1Y7_9BURK|nr:DUF4136 domain-containing protein [Undibacterium piscinae]
MRLVDVARAIAGQLQCEPLTEYKTFAFVTPLDRPCGYQSIVSQELKANTTREMEARGMRLVDVAPQLLVNFNASLSDDPCHHHAGINSGLGMGVGYYGYRGGMYSPWPMYMDQTVVTQYKEGTLNIDVVDAARKQLLWEGVVTDSVTHKDLSNLPEAISIAVKAAFAKYPIPAPSK